MDIKDFVKETIQQINTAIDESDTGGTVSLNNNKNGIEFDIAVVVKETQDSSKSGGAGMKLQVLNVGGDASSSSTTTSEQTSRIKFSVFST